MKKLLFLSAILMAVFTGCSSDEPEKNDGGTFADVEASYMTVNVVTELPGSRAEGDSDINEAEFEDGLDKESEVTDVRFYFFDDKGNAAAVKQNLNSKDSYFDYKLEPANSTNPTEKPEEHPNVTKVISATIVINAPQDALPSSMVAIVNPTDELKKLTNPSLSKLLEYVEAHKSDKFVMSNSVYSAKSNGDDNKPEIYKYVEQSVKGHIYVSEASALRNPVTIYVERVLAKVSMDVNFGDNDKKTLADGTEIYKAYVKDDANKAVHKFDNKDVYVKFLGWNVTATIDNSYLVKSINPNWTDENLFGNLDPWNNPAYHRSFWAANPTGEHTYSYYDFNNDGEFAANAFDFTNKAYTYLQENASDNLNDGTEPTTPSKVIIAAQLVDENGGMLEFAQWGFEKFTLKDLPERIADICEIWVVEKISEDGTTVLEKRKLKPEELKLVAAEELGINKGQKVESGRYYTYAQLGNVTVKPQYCDKNGKIFADEKDTESNIVKTAEDLVNEKLIALGGAKVWKDGFTYYYFDIEHLGDKVGVVRNHVYKANVKSLTGLGTPVYNPDLTIIPEKPKDDFSYIAADIRVLAWRIVNSDIDLKW